MSRIVHGTHNDFIELECTLQFNSKEFESGGAYIMKRKDTQKLEGVLYAYPQEQKVGTWDGSQKWPACFGHEWRSNKGDRRQSVYFTYHGVSMYGVFYKEHAAIVRCRQIK